MSREWGSEHIDWEYGDIDAFVKKYKVPVEKYGEGCFISIRQSLDYVGNGVVVSFVEKESGLVSTRIKFGYEEKKLAPMSLSRHDYFDGEILYPGIRKSYTGTWNVERCWSIDSLYQHKERQSVYVMFMRYEDDWDIASGDSKRKGYPILDSSFTSSSERLGSESEPIVFTESLRGYHIHGHLVYEAQGDPPTMRYYERKPMFFNREDEQKWREGHAQRMKELEEDGIPLDLGPPMEVTF